MTRGFLACVLLVLAVGGLRSYKILQVCIDGPVIAGERFPSNGDSRNRIGCHFIR